MGRAATGGKDSTKLVELLGAPPAFADAGAPPMRALLQDHAEKDWRDVIARLDVPALYLAGRDSQFWPYAHAVEAAGSNARATAMVIEDSGHAVNIDQPEQTNTALLEFLS